MYVLTHKLISHGYVREQAYVEFLLDYPRHTEMDLGGLCVITPLYCLRNSRRLVRANVAGIVPSRTLYDFPKI